MGGRIILDSDDTSHSAREIEIAKILATRLSVDIALLRPSVGYKTKTPDLLIKSVAWEIKSPKGSSRKTIENQIKRASKQSKYIVLDSLNIKLNNFQVYNLVNKSFQMHSGIRHIILIDKLGAIIEFKR